MFDEHDDSIGGQLIRATLAKVNDSGKQQIVAAEGIFGQMVGEAVRRQHFGFTNVAPAGSEGLFLLPGGRFDRSELLGLEHPDHRPKNLKPGESAHYDDQKQILHLARDGYKATAKKHTLTAGDKADTSGFELNEQLKGLAARMAQAEHNLHGLFDVTSRFREIVQGAIPAVAEVQDILNKDPTTGLKNMADAIASKAQAYLQSQVKQALEKFLSPNLAGLSSLMSGNLEGLIGALQSQIADLVTQNPVVATVDALTSELQDLLVSGAEAAVIGSRSAELTGSIAALTGANTIVATVAGLRGTLQGLLDQAGPGLNFLAPQKRLVQGISKSLRLGGPG